jgi:hypothetical protein
MKSLVNAADKEELLQRIVRVQPSDERLWGRMSAHQMICHLADAYRVYTGEISAEPVPVPAIVKALVRTTALYVPLHWPKGRIPTLPKIDQVAGYGTPPAEFAKDVHVLNNLLEQFSRLPESHTFNQHPGLGRLSYSQWMRLGYLHSDHHLRQFGA